LLASRRSAALARNSPVRTDYAKRTFTSKASDTGTNEARCLLCLSLGGIVARPRRAGFLPANKR